MNAQIRNRGLVAVNANQNTSSLLTELSQSVTDFKAKHGGDMRDIQNAVDQLNRDMAALQIGGQGGLEDDPDTPASRRAQAAVVEFMRTGNPSAMNALQPRAEMSIDSNPDGGFTVPVEIDNTIQNQLVEVSPMRRLANVVNVTMGEYKKLLGVRGASSGWAGERDPRAETDTPDLREIVPPGGEVWAYPSLTNWLLQDSGFNLNQWLNENVLDEFAAQESSAFIGGSGLKKPFGLLSNDAVELPDETRPHGKWEFVKSGGASGFASSDPADALKTLVHKVKPSYRAGERVGWLMNSTTIGEIDKFKDGQGNYLWRDSPAAGVPPTFLGYPVYEDEYMPDIGANALPIAFGNFKRGYVIVDRAGTQIISDRVTKPGWTRLYFSRRVHGSPVDTKAIKFLKIAA